MRVLKMLVSSLVVIIFLICGGCAPEKPVEQSGGLPTGYEEVQNGTLNFKVVGATKDTKVQLLNNKTGDVITPIWLGNESYSITVKASTIGTYSVQFFNSNTQLYETIASNPVIIINNVEKSTASGAVDYVIASKIDGTIKVGQFSEYNEEKGKLQIVIENSVKGKQYIVTVQLIDDSLALPYEELKKRALRTTRGTTSLKEYTIIGTGASSQVFSLDITKEDLGIGSYKVSVRDANSSSIAIVGGEDNGKYITLKIAKNDDTGTTVVPGIITVSEVAAVEEGDTKYFPFTFSEDNAATKFYETFFNVVDIHACKTGTIEEIAVKKNGNSFALNVPTATKSVSVTFLVQATNLIPLKDNVSTFEVTKTYSIISTSDADGNITKTISGSSALMSDSSIKVGLSETDLTLNFSYFYIKTGANVDRLTASVQNQNSYAWITSGLDKYGVFTKMTTKDGELQYQDSTGTKETKVGIFTLGNHNKTNTISTSLQAQDKSKSYTTDLNCNTKTTIETEVGNMKYSAATVSEAKTALRIKIKDYDGFYKIVLADKDINPFANLSSKAIFGAVALVKENNDTDGRNYTIIKMFNLKNIKSETDNTSLYDEGLSFFIDKERFDEIKSNTNINRKKLAFLVFENEKAGINSQVYEINRLNDFSIITEDKVAALINNSVRTLNGGKDIILDSQFEDSNGTNFVYLNGKIYIKNYTSNLKDQLDNIYEVSINNEKQNAGVGYKLKLRCATSNLEQEIIQKTGRDDTTTNEDESLGNADFFKEGRIVPAADSYYVNAASVLQNIEKKGTESFLDLNTLNKGVKARGRLVRNYDKTFIRNHWLINVEDTKYFYGIQETTAGVFSAASLLQNNNDQTHIEAYKNEPLYVNPESDIEIVPSDLSFRVKMSVAERFNEEGNEITTVDNFSGLNFGVNTSAGYESAFNQEKDAAGNTVLTEDMRMKYAVEAAAVGGNKLGQFGQNYEQGKEIKKFVANKTTSETKINSDSIKIFTYCTMLGVGADVKNHLSKDKSWSGDGTISAKNWKCTMVGSITGVGIGLLYNIVGKNWDKMAENERDVIYWQSKSTWADQFNNTYGGKVDFEKLFHNKFPELYDADEKNDADAVLRLKTYLEDHIFDPKEINYSNVWTSYIYLDHDTIVSDILQVPKAKTMDSIKVRVLHQISSLDTVPQYTVGYQLSGTNNDYTDMKEITAAEDSSYPNFKKNTRNTILKKGWYMLNMKVEKIGGGKADNSNGWAVAQPVNASVFRAESTPTYTLTSKISKTKLEIAPTYQNIRIAKSQICGVPFGSITYYHDPEDVTVSKSIATKKVKIKK